MNRRGSIAAAEHLDGTVTSNQQDKITSVDCGQLGQPRRGNGKTSPSWATRPVDYTEVRTRLVPVPPGQYYRTEFFFGYPVPVIIIFYYFWLIIIIVPNLFLVTRYPGIFFPRYPVLFIIIIN